MKTPLTVVLLVLICAFHLNAQDGPKREVSHKAWVFLTDGTKMTGVLYSANEEGILLRGDNLNDPIAPTSITAIKIRRKGKVGKGALYGAAGGAVVGFTIGILSGDDDPGWFSSTKEEKAGIGALFLTPIGAVIGGLVGTKRITIPIDGSTETYKAQLPAIQRYCLQ